MMRFEQISGLLKAIPRPSFAVLSSPLNGGLR
jgi:hypothetical protein